MPERDQAYVFMNRLMNIGRYDNVAKSVHPSEIDVNDDL